MGALGSRRHLWMKPGRERPLGREPRGASERSHDLRNHGLRRHPKAISLSQETPMTNAAADPHVRTLPRSPHTPNAKGTIVCPCGRRWHLERSYGEGEAPCAKL